MNEPVTPVTCNTGYPVDLLARRVKPRDRKYSRRPVMAVYQDQAIDEQGEIMTLDELIARLPKMGSMLFGTFNSGDFVATLTEHYEARWPKEWQYRVSHHDRYTHNPNNKGMMKRTTPVIPFFGWTNGAKHKAIDCIGMYGKRLDEIWPGPPDTYLTRLLAWTVTIRDFCDENNVEVRPTIGGISAQFLTDSRFYPNPRRKVPAATNASARDHMPGNYYRLMVEPRERDNFTAHYLDQYRAHHYHARTVKLPNADHLYAYGRFSDLAECVFDSVIDNFYGLYCLDLTWHRKGTKAYAWIEGYDATYTKQFVWSNELEHLTDMGFTVTGVRAAWGSRSRDTGIAKFATWAEAELDKHQDPAWLKPLLLSTYGILAATPRHAETVFRLASKGEPVTIVTGNKTLSGLANRSTRKLEPRIANVLHRGMIEAACRSESVGLAQWLAADGHQILSIYADAVIVQENTDRQLPSLPEPWRSKGTLTHLQFVNQQAFVSTQMTKLPGVAGRDFSRYSSLRAPAPRFRRENVAELMEREEIMNTLITQHQRK